MPDWLRRLVAVLLILLCSLVAGVVAAICLLLFEKAMVWMYPHEEPDWAHFIHQFHALEAFLVGAVYMIIELIIFIKEELL